MKTEIIQTVITKEFQAANGLKVTVQAFHPTIKNRNYRTTGLESDIVFTTEIGGVVNLAGVRNTGRGVELLKRELAALNIEIHRWMNAAGEAATELDDDAAITPLIVALGLANCA